MKIELFGYYLKFAKSEPLLRQRSAQIHSLLATRKQESAARLKELLERLIAHINNLSDKVTAPPKKI